MSRYLDLIDDIPSAGQQAPWPAELSPLLRRISAAQGWTREEAQDFRQHARTPGGVNDARACLSHLAAAMPDPAMLDRRRKVRDMLANNTTLTMAYLVDNADTDPVVLTVAIRGKGTIELGIPREKFDALGLPGLIDKLVSSGEPK